MMTLRQRWLLAAVLGGAIPSLVVLSKGQTGWIRQEVTAMVNEAQEIKLGVPVERTMQGKQTHSYTVDMEVGQFIYLVVEQKGIDVVVELYGPDGNLHTTVDSPSGDWGPETVSEIADAAGEYRVAVISEYDDTPAGQYEVRLEELRQASQADRQFVEADRIFAEAEELRRQGTSQSRRQAIEKYRQALSIWEMLPQRKPLREAHCHHRIGMVHRDLVEYREAEPSLEKALALFRENGDGLWEGVVLNWLGPIQFRFGKVEQALESSRTALAIAEELDRRDLQAGAFNNIGNAHNYLGEADSALQAYNEAISRAQAVKNPFEEVIARFGVGDILLYQGRLQEARDALDHALQLARRISDRATEIRILLRLANLHQRLDDMQPAFESLHNALKLSQAHRDRGGEAVILSSLGTLYLLSDELDQAERCYQDALSIFRRTGDRLHEAVGLLNLGRFFWKRGDAQRAFDFHEESGRLFQEIGNRRWEASTLYGSARALHDLGRFAAAHERLQRVVDNVEHLRSESEILDLRIGFFATRQHYYELHIDVLMHLHGEDPTFGYDDLALQVNESRKARGLLELLAESEAGIPDATDPDMTAQAAEVQKKLNATHRLVLNLMEQRDRGEQGRAEQIDAMQLRQRQLLQELNQIRAKMRRQSPRYAAMTQLTPLSVQGIQRSVLDEHSLLLAYSLGDERSFLWCLSKTGRMSSYVLPSRSYLEKAAREVHQGWSSGSAESAATKRWAERLSQEVFQPVAKRLGKNRLLIVSDGWLQNVPFAALPDPNASTDSKSEPPQADPLVVNHEIIHLPSATVLATLRSQFGDRLPAPRRAAVFADPVFSPDDPRVTNEVAVEGDAGSTSPQLERAALDFGISSFQRLPFSRQEAEIIRGLIKDEYLRFEALDFEASKEAVMSGQLARYRLIHFATHGLLNFANPELSGLVLSLVDEAGKPRAGFLHAHEIFNLNLPAELVVLSACQTGIGEQIRGEGLMSLTRSFMYAGTPRLIVSLWQVNDQGTYELMKRFYQRLFQGGLYPAAALRCAQLSMHQDSEWNLPNHWAGFTFQGEWLHDLSSSDTPIERLATGSEPKTSPDDDLPPPIPVEPPGCPPDSDFSDQSNE